ELLVPRVRAGIAALDVVDAELIELARDLELVVQREREPLALHAVAKGGVVEFDAGGHRYLPYFTLSRSTLSAISLPISWVVTGRTTWPSPASPAMSEVR